ncbi:MAG: thiamine phosphate synthase [Muribaculaceae bacterium]
MLQYIIPVKSSDTPPEAIVAAALEAGCGWIQLRLDSAISDAEAAAMLPPVVDICRDAAAFLTVEDRPELAATLGLHGVHLTGTFAGSSPIELRATMGAEAVIGVEVSSPAQVMALKGKDLDYVSVSLTLSEEYRRSIYAAASSEPAMPAVLTGDIDADGVPAAFAAGASGIASVHYGDEAAATATVAAMLAAISEVMS